MTRSRHTSKRKLTKLQARFLKIGLAVIAILLLCIVAVRNERVQGRLISSFGDNQKLQKQEYERQKAIATSKYGSTSTTASSSTKESEKAAESDDSTTKAPSSQENSAKSSSSTKKKATDSGNYTTYTVRSGDYLSTIAAKYNTTVQELMELNDLSSSSVNAGEVLKVPATTSTTSSATDTATSSTATQNTQTQSSQTTQSATNTYQDDDEY
ncbi:LysM peptidoglycan-binding domain-containing protein [Ligilactobacillus apodemi]|nr:LysM peptidoglycan-binding domain-containing protein [Ligilactobacillus apodemi]